MRHDHPVRRGFMLFDHFAEQVHCLCCKFRVVCRDCGSWRIQTFRNALKFPVDPRQFLRNADSERMERGGDFQRILRVDADQRGTSLPDCPPDRFRQLILRRSAETGEKDSLPFRGGTAEFPHGFQKALPASGRFAGLADVGPSKNFGGLSILSKYVLMFDMLAGRLELFPMLVLFHPVLWKETWEGGKRRRRRLKRKKVS